MYNNFNVYGIKMLVFPKLVLIIIQLKVANLLSTLSKRKILHYVYGITKPIHVIHHNLQMMLYQHIQILIVMLKQITPIIMMVIVVLNVMS